MIINTKRHFVDNKIVGEKKILTSLLRLYWIFKNALLKRRPAPPVIKRVASAKKLSPNSAALSRVLALPRFQRLRLNWCALKDTLTSFRPAPPVRCKALINKGTHTLLNRLAQSLATILPRFQRLRFNRRAFTIFKNLRVCLVATLLFCSLKSFSQEALLITPADINLEVQVDGGKISGYLLSIKAKEGLGSVMLTETTKDPQMKEANYAYRAQTYNKINGDEKRILNGKFLETKLAQYSLISSTIATDKHFGRAFKIFIPTVLLYGYPWTRHGEVAIGRGTFINIRAFSRPYCDYEGGFRDNPYMFNLAANRNGPALTDDYNEECKEKFEELSVTLTISKGPETIIDDVMQNLDTLDPKKSADVVFAIDATGSMKDDIEALREKLCDKLDKWLATRKNTRLGLLLYRDYPDNYRYKGLPVKFFDFTTNAESFKKNLNAFSINGKEGGDIPEAVYEALYGSVMFYSWAKGAQKLVILIGDAPPHPKPRNSGMYSKALVTKLATEKGVKVRSIITPDDKSKRGR